MSTPPQKPPTRESLDAAKRFAASLPALPMSKRVSQTDYERGFEQGYHEGYSTGYQAGLRKAQEIITKQ